MQFDKSRGYSLGANRGPQGTYGFQAFRSVAPSRASMPSFGTAFAGMGGKAPNYSRVNYGSAPQMAGGAGIYRPQAPFQPPGAVDRQPAYMPSNITPAQSAFVSPPSQFTPPPTMARPQEPQGPVSQPAAPSSPWQPQVEAMNKIIAAYAAQQQPQQQTARFARGLYTRDL